MLIPTAPRIAQPWVLQNLPLFRSVALKLVRLAAQDDVLIGSVPQGSPDGPGFLGGRVTIC